MYKLVALLNLFSNLSNKKAKLENELLLVYQNCKALHIHNKTTTPQIRKQLPKVAHKIYNKQLLKEILASNHALRKAQATSK